MPRDSKRSPRVPVRAKCPAVHQVPHPRRPDHRSSRAWGRASRARRRQGALRLHRTERGAGERAGAQGRGHPALPSRALPAGRGAPEPGIAQPGSPQTKLRWLLGLSKALEPAGLGKTHYFCRLGPAPTPTFFAHNSANRGAPGQLLLHFFLNGFKASWQSRSCPSSFRVGESNTAFALGKEAWWVPDVCEAASHGRPLKPTQPWLSAWVAAALGHPQGWPRSHSRTVRTKTPELPPLG